jgi:hypothetical protein
VFGLMATANCQSARSKLWNRNLITAAFREDPHINGMQRPVNAFLLSKQVNMLSTSGADSSIQSVEKKASHILQFLVNYA